jgi:hypothetical protein
MGTDFLRNKRQRHTKSWRYGLRNAAADMFAQVTKVRRVVRAKTDADVKLSPNDSVLFRMTPGGRVVASDGLHPVATVEKPSRALLAKLKLHHNAAHGKVHRIHPGTGSVELLLED